MSRPAIEVSGLSKRYVIEHESRHDNLRDTLHHTARKLWRRFRWGTGFAREEFWALRDVSFSVQPGEVVGIIGRNGAGKSTLLKILSRITEATAGKVTLRGRVASLLEVGTGFHPDLTGRENIFLNGAILGMSRAEIRRKFDEIVAFAEIEQFLDTPVKRYSSGMYVRLAFAVAAHLEPEILIVDEVLAVGDAAFQKKCLGKMQEVATGQGRTVLYVSHNMATVSNLCHRAVLLQQGRVARIGQVNGIISAYLTAEQGDARGKLAYSRTTPARSPYHILEAAVLSEGVDEVFDANHGLTLVIRTNVALPRDVCLGMKVENNQGLVILDSNTDVAQWPSAGCTQRDHFRLQIPPRVLRAGHHYFTLSVSKRGYEFFDRLDSVLDVVLSEGASDHGVDTTSWAGVINPNVLKCL